MARLFYDDEKQAIEACIIDSGKSHKEVAIAIWPGRKPETAYARLKACLSTDGDVHLTLGEIIAICRYCDRYDVLMYMADELSHARPAPITQESKLEAMLARFFEVTGEAERISTAIRKIRPAA